MSEPVAGDRLDQYELQELLARSGMAAIFKARDTFTGATVALKIPHFQYESDIVFSERFRREEEVGQKLELGRWEVAWWGQFFGLLAGSRLSTPARDRVTVPSMGKKTQPSDVRFTPPARHVVMCADTRKEGCASAKQLKRAWKHLGERLAEEKLDREGFTHRVGDRRGLR